MKITLITCSLLIIGSAKAQSTIIKYNYQDESFAYYKITKDLDTVRTRKPYGYSKVPTKLVIEDLNTFYYGVKFNTNSTQDEPIGAQQGMAALSESFAQGATAFNALVGEVQNSDIYKSLWSDGKFQGMEGLKSALGAGAADYPAERKKIEEQGLMLENSQKKIADETSLIKEVFTDLVVLELVNEQLVKLQMNKDIGLKEMQQRAYGLISKVLDAPTLENAVTKWQESTDDMQSAYYGFKGAYNLYNSQKSMVVGTIEEMKASVGDGVFYSQISDFQQEINYKYAEISNTFEALDHLMDEFNPEKIKNDYVHAFEAYDQIMNADFDFEYSVKNELDVTTVTMEFYELKGGDSTGQVLKTRTVDIPTKGGLRINSSAGVSFLRFIDGHATYNSDNGVVNKVQGDAFLPSLTTMFHFYRQTPNPLMFGGSFGISVPTEGDKEFIYMMGTSLIIGKTQRVIFNLGGFGGKINRLEGLSVGDSVVEGSIIPVNSVFDFGIYAGLTFNISSLF